MKIAVYAISKNESQFVERFCKSAKDADYVVIGDTGSTDDTVELAKSFGAIVHDITITPWRFDLARNAVLGVLPRDTDICISLDLDEVLEPGWREEIEKVWTENPDTTNLWYYFDWGSGYEFWYRKIHSRKGYFWHHACHEDLRLDPRVGEKNFWLPKKLVSHYPDPTKSRGQYMALLDAAVKEDDRDPAHYFYYSRELTFNCRWEEARVAFHKYLSMPNATNPNERCYAMRTLADVYQNLSNEQEREKWLLAAAGEAPGTREPWVALSRCMFDHGRWAECFAFASRALSITMDSKVYTMDPAVWGGTPHDLAGISAWYLGMKEQAIFHGENAVTLEPENDHYRRNFEWYKKERSDVEGSHKNKDVGIEFDDSISLFNICES